MSLLTLQLIGLLLAAWKAPAWVKEIGLLALVTGFLSILTGFYSAASTLSMAPDVSPALVFMGFRVSLIAVIYGCLVYIASLVIRIIQKPKI